MKFKNPLKILLGLGETLRSYRRVLALTKKADRTEFKDIARICAIGTLIIGIIGFAMYLISILFIG